MSKKSKIILLILGLLLVTASVIRLTGNKKKTEERVYHFDRNKAINVTVDTLHLSSDAAFYTYTGTFEPFKETKVSADIQGRVNRILVDVGSYVRQGQPLVYLDKSLLDLQLKSIDVQLEGLRTEVERLTVLANADAVQRVQLEKAENNLKSVQIQKSTVQEQIRKTRILAPFSGVVTAKLTEVGAFAAPGIPLLQITNINSLKFTVNVPESNLSLFTMGATHRVEADSYPELPLSGKVTMIGSKANLGNSFPVQLLVPANPGMQVKAGMFGRVTVNTGEADRRIIIPASAVLGTTLKPQVYTVRNGKAAVQDITISERFENKAVVAQGLKDGDVLVTSGFINLYDGAAILTK